MVDGDPWITHQRKFTIGVCIVAQWTVPEFLDNLLKFWLSPRSSILIKIFSKGWIILNSQTTSINLFVNSASSLVGLYLGLVTPRVVYAPTFLEQAPFVAPLFHIFFAPRHCSAHEIGAGKTPLFAPLQKKFSITQIWLVASLYAPFAKILQCRT